MKMCHITYRCIVTYAPVMSVVKSILKMDKEVTEKKRIQNEYKLHIAITIIVQDFG